MPIKRNAAICIVLSLLILSCGQGTFVGPTLTPAPTPQPTIISTATPSPEEIIAQIVAVVCEGQPPLSPTVGFSTTGPANVRLCPNSYDQIMLPEERDAKTPENLQFVVRFTDGTVKIGQCGPYIPVGSSPLTSLQTYVDWFGRYVDIDLINIKTGEVEDRTSVESRDKHCPDKINGTAPLTGDLPSAEAIQQALDDLLSPSDVRTLNAHSGAPVHHVAFSPDGKVLASSGESLIFWSLTNHLPHPFESEIGSDFAFSPDGKLIVSNTPDGTVALWDVTTQLEIRTIASIDGNGVIINATYAFSPDGTLIATVVGTEVKIWETASGREVQVLKGDRVDASFLKSIAFSPDGKLLASVRGTRVSFWDTARWYEVRTLIVLRSGSVEGIAFSPDGKLLASVASDDVIRLWNVSNGQLIAEFSGQATEVAFSPNGVLLATASEDTVILWDVTSGREVRTLVHGSSVQSIAFSPDGIFLASGAWDGTIKLWQVEQP